MKRVMIVGGPGSGKSTLANLLGSRSGLPVFHMDHIHWKSGWIERSKVEKDQLTHKVHMLDRWIFEGGHSRTYDERVERADTFIWLDFPVWIRLWRVLRRSVVNAGRTRPDLPDGCPEQLNKETIEFLRFIWRTRKTSRAKLQKIYNKPPPTLTTYHLNSRKAVQHFLRNLT
ncbi:DNA topology modulation protein FlaR [Pelagibius litoralis]|uniref:DNA topology modulation protein FlaR n=1 Tax=Pelagibius litoralis TaxID=374515 RepID=A0A967F200_9PROT|nr:DNA topology modulation protein FlaR [Pelagibius litoralis]NIA71703.1 DNA topology modulation protein FlaR [Pelagibius litoralis]